MKRFLFGLMIGLSLSAASSIADFGPFSNEWTFWQSVDKKLDRIVIAVERMSPSPTAVAPVGCRNRVGATIPCAEKP